MSAVKRKVQLPSLKTTERRVGGSIVHRVLPRSCLDPTLEDKKRPKCVEDNQDTFDFPLESISADVPLCLPSLHEIKQKANVKAWETLRSSLLSTVTECSAMPQDQSCTLCSVAEATFRCLQCGPCVFYCSSCLHEWHSRSNVFHMAEEWKVHCAVE